MAGSIREQMTSGASPEALTARKHINPTRAYAYPDARVSACKYQK